MRIKHLVEGLNAQQRSVPQLPAQARAKHISVLGAKTDPKHPFAGYMVGADESAEPGLKRIGPDKNDPYEQGWRAGHRRGQDKTACPYQPGTPKHAQWMDGYEEARAQPDHYNEGVTEDDVDEGWKSKLAGAALAGAAAFGGGGQAQAASPAGVNATGTNAAVVQSLVNPVAQQRFAKMHADTTAKLTDPRYTHNPDALAQHQAAPQQQHAEMLQNIKNIEQWDNPYRIIQMAMNMAGVTPKEVLQNLPKGYKLPTTEPKGTFVPKDLSKLNVKETGKQGVKEGRAGIDDTDTVGFSVNSEAAYTAVMRRFGDAIDHDETSGIMYAPARVWPQIEMVAFDADGEGAMRDEGIEEEQLDEKCWDGYEKKGMKTMFGKRVPNCVKNEGAERNELDTAAVQAALARMAKRHKGEKWSKEQLAALGKRIAARGQAKKGVDETVSTHKGGKITKTPTGIKHQAAPGNYGGYEPEFDHLRTLDKNTTGRIERSMDIKHKREKAWQGGIELDVDEGLKSKLAGAALAGAAALGGGGAAVAHDHGDYGHYDQRLDDRSWDTAGYDDHIKSDTKLTKTTTPDGKVSRDSQRRISSVQGPNAQGEYRVFVGQNGKIVSSYITKTPPQNWMVKEDVTKEDIITKLKARLGDYLSDLSKEIKSDPDLVDKLAAKSPGDQMGPSVKTITTDDGHEIQIHGNEDDGFRISIKNKQSASKFKNLDEAVMACEMYCAQRRKQTESADYIDEAGKDACYNKVKSRYKIWPSAYASGALVQCRKAGADNWGNKSKK
jgi:ribosome modulation factor